MTIDLIMHLDFVGLVTRFTSIGNQRENTMKRSQSNTKLKSGLRVQLVLGDSDNTRTWIAGVIRVGAKGTVKKKRGGPYHIEWDNVQSLVPGLLFGLVGDTLPHYLTALELMETKDTENAEV